jgi:aminopeptidase
MNGPEFDRMLRKYADVILSVGVNLQRGQRLDLRTDVQDKELARQLAIRAYEMGASLVDVLWVDETLDRIRFDYANPETLTVVPDWIIKRHQEHGDRGDAYVIIFSKDPDLLHGVNPEHIATYRQSLLQRLEPTFKYIDNSLINWNAVSTSTPSRHRKNYGKRSSKLAASTRRIRCRHGRSIKTNFRSDANT